MNYDQFLSPVFRDILEQNRQLHEVVFGPVRRMLEGLESSRRDLDRLVSLTARDLASIRTGFDAPRGDLLELERMTDTLLVQKRSLGAGPADDALSFIAKQYSGFAAIEKLGAWVPRSVARTAVVPNAVLLPVSLRTRFSEETLHLLRDETDALRAVALTTSLRHSTVELNTYAATISRLPRPSEVTVMEPALEMTLPEADRAELLARSDEIGATEESVRADTTAHRISMLGIRLIDRLVSINEASKMGDRKEIFHPTTRGYESIALLSSTLATDAVTFCRVTNALYFLLYEGAGSATLRLLTEHGGPLTKDECTALWQLKTLRRNEDHDVDHGPQPEQAKKWHALGKCLRALGLERIPQNSEDYATLQLSLYENLDLMLSLALSRLALPLDS